MPYAWVRSILQILTLFKLHQSWGCKTCSDFSQTDTLFCAFHSGGSEQEPTFPAKNAKNLSAVTQHKAKSGAEGGLLLDIVADNESPLSATPSEVRRVFRLLRCDRGPPPRQLMAAAGGCSPDFHSWAVALEQGVTLHVGVTEACGVRCCV